MSWFGSVWESQLLKGSKPKAPQMQLKPCASISNECQVQHVVWLSRVPVARGGGCPVWDRWGATYMANNRCWRMLPFYSQTRATLRVISQLLAISIWTERTGPGIEQKANVFPEEGGKEALEILEMSPPFEEYVLDIQNAQAAVETKAVGRKKRCQVCAKSEQRLDIKDECVITEKSR